MTYPDKAFYCPGETITIPVGGSFRATIWHLADEVLSLDGEGTLIWTPPAQPRCGYRVRIMSDAGELWTAFDVLQSWTDSPRYGFLFDFSPQNNTIGLDYLLANHINGIQFYDWMYRHDTLIPPSNEFIDPLGRKLSLEIVREYIRLAHQHGMAAMPYTAIYAASPEFAADHLDWGLYDATGVLYDFAEGFLKIMNPASGWRQHFIKECVQVLDVLPFDGIHVDQYGEPRTGYNRDAKAIDLPLTLAYTLLELHAAIPHDKTLLFNLVHNWPLEPIANTPVDFLYCEIWPPKTRLRDLAEIARQNWQQSGGKTPVVAVYINPKNEFTAKIVECVLLASGSYHLVHGEGGLYLSDPYFPKAVTLGAALQSYLQRIADFGVAYQELLNHAQPTVVEADCSDDIWLIARLNKNHLLLNLLNVSPDMQWNQDILASPIQEDVAVKLSVSKIVNRVWCVSPDTNTPPLLLDFGVDEGQLTFCVPRIETWTMVCVDFIY